VGSRANRITHVVQGVEHRHQVIARARIGAGRGDLETAALSQPGVGRHLLGMLDRRLVVVEADEG
jgi:hypothetical protein